MKKLTLISLKSFCLITTIIFSYYTVTAQTTYWSGNGSYGGHINCLTLSKSNSDILYAGTEYGLYKTEDGGNTWVKTNFPNDYEVTSIKVHSTNSDIVLAGTYRSGVYRSANGGQSWIYKGLSDFTISTMALDDSNPDLLYFGIGEEMNLTDIRIYKFYNDWASGELIKAWEGWDECGWRKVCKIAVDPDNSSSIYAVGLNSGYCSNYGGVLFSEDGGATWDDKNTGYSNMVSNISITKKSNGEKTIFILDGGTNLSAKDAKLFKSDDQGDTWQAVEIPYSGKINLNILTSHPQDQSSLIIGSYEEDKPLWIYNSETNSWSYINGNGLPGSISPTCLESGNNNGLVFYMATLWGGIYKFDENINSWEKINTGINNSVVNDFVVNPNSCNTVYAATEEEEFLNKSTDAGNTWAINQSNIGASFDVLTIDPNNPSVFYAGLNASVSGYYLFKGQQNGQYWTDPIDFVECVGNACYTEITDILVKPGNSNSILVSTQPYFLSSGLSGFGTVTRTTDGGSNWDELISVAGAAMAVDPQYPDVVYIGKERSGQVFKVENAWENQNATEITPDEGIENVQDIAVDNQGNIYVATEDGLWRRNGTNWTKLNCPADNITTLAVDNTKALTVVYAGSEGDGIFVSEDSGESWMIINDGLGNLNIKKLVVCESMLYAGTEYGGIWSRIIPETFTPSFLTHNTGNMKISVFQNGSFGHAAPNWNYGEGLVYKNNIDPLFNSGLIVGTSQRGFVNGQLGVFSINNDFQNTTPISGFETIQEWDQVTTCSFNDNSSTLPYGLDVSQRTYSKSGEDLLMVKYSIKNTSDEIDDLYVGLFTDWDVGGEDYHDKNKGGFDLFRNLAYQYLEGGEPDPNYYGIVALDGVAGTSITGKGSQLYIRDSSFTWISEMNTSEITEAGEYRMWIGSGPFNLQEEECVQVYFAIVAGSNLEELQDNAEIASQKYQSLLTEIDEKTEIENGFNLKQNYPNPSSQQTKIEYSIPSDCNVKLDLINIEGMKIKTIVNKNHKAGKYKINFNSANLSSGIYFYRLRVGTLSQTKKMVVK
ncbi:MAG: T9SS type A sorting domain-containing protein [Prolixibacteraceae bacterium]|jgi:photosystem II stability/assembly factor-like uncharacterized protein|nr:T9SS type A sorting domain-containing protein [Prolixibacteraceae bacterium]